MQLLYKQNCINVDQYKNYNTNLYVEQLHVGELIYYYYVRLRVTLAVTAKTRE